MRRSYPSDLTDKQWERLAERAAWVPEEEIADLPTDLASQHDHYAYGAPRRR